MSSLFINKKDGDGYLNLDEVKEALNPGDQAEIDDQVWKCLIGEVDTDGDGKVNRIFFVGQKQY